MRDVSGKAVLKQLQIWENLLGLRIKLQGCMRSFNQLPRQDLNTYLHSADEATKANLAKGKKYCVSFSSVNGIHKSKEMD